jgi:hypothetical protein
MHVLCTYAALRLLLIKPLWASIHVEAAWTARETERTQPLFPLKSLNLLMIYLSPVGISASLVSLKPMNTNPVLIVRRAKLLTPAIAAGYISDSAFVIVSDHEHDHGHNHINRILVVPAL